MPKPWEIYGGRAQDNAPKPWDAYSVNSNDQEPQESLGRTVFDQGMQGATFGFADEISDRLGAAGATLYSNAGQLFSDNVPDIDYDAALEEARQLTRERQRRQFEQRPGASIAANMAGGLLTGGAGATTKAGTSIGDFIRSGNLATRVGKGAVSGAASGGLYGFGAGQDSERLQSAGEGALLGAAGGAAIPAAMAGLRRANTRTVIPNADKIRKAAGSLYKTAEQKGGVLNSQFVDGFLARAERDLLSSDEVIRSMKANKPLADAFDDLSLFRNQPMTLQRAQALDEQLGDMITANTDMGTVNKVGKKLLDVQSTFREMIEGADESLIEGGADGFQTLKEARKMWGASRRMDDIERIIQRAEMMQQPANGIKSGFRTLYNNPKRMRGFSDAERKAIKKAADTGFVGDLLSTAGSRLVGVIGAGTGNPMLAGAGYAGSKIARDSAEKLQLGRANKILEEIAKDTGLAKTQQRIPIKEIMKLPPAKAKAAINALYAEEKSQ